MCVLRVFDLTWITRSPRQFFICSALYRVRELFETGCYDLCSKDVSSVPSIENVLKTVLYVIKLVSLVWPILADLQGILEISLEETQHYSYS